MDAFLVAIAQLAEVEKPCPIVRIVAGSVMATGRPARSSTFVEAMWDGFVQDARGPRWRKESDDDTRALAESWYVPIRDALAAEDTPSALTLAPCEVWPIAGGDGLRLPVIRIPLDAIDSWFVVTGKTLSGGGSWFVGGIFPLPGS